MFVGLILASKTPEVNIRRIDILMAEDIRNKINIACFLIQRDDYR